MAKKLIIEIEMGNDAFQHDEGDDVLEVDRLLAEFSKKANQNPSRIRDVNETTSLYDINGNTVFTARVIEED